jgi:hypothetical protein
VRCILRRVYRIGSGGAASKPSTFFHPDSFIERRRAGPKRDVHGVSQRDTLLCENTFFTKRLQSGLKTGYNLRMFLAVFAMRVLEVMFFVGLAGSTVVVLISFVEDGIELFGKDEPPQSRADGPRA